MVKLQLPVYNVLQIDGISSLSQSYLTVNGSYVEILLNMQVFLKQHLSSCIVSNGFVNQIDNLSPFSLAGEDHSPAYSVQGEKHP